MRVRHHLRQWRAIVQGVGIVYGVTFLSGLVLAFNEISPQTDPVAYTLIALLSGAVGVAIALGMAETTRLADLVALGVGIWLLDSTSVLLGAQTLSGWGESGAFVATTVIFGRLMLGISLEPAPASAQTFR